MSAENFDMTSSDEITLKGFYSLHTLTAADSEGGVEELRAILAAMGYDRKLRLRHVSVVHVCACVRACVRVCVCVSLFVCEREAVTVESSVVCVWSIYQFVVMIIIHLSPPHLPPHLPPHTSHTPPPTGLSVLYGHSLGDV